jgi:hypothetical protein
MRSTTVGMNKPLYWKTPPVEKVYEAITAVLDQRILIDLGKPNQGRCYSSSGNKYYDIEFDPQKEAITANDNSAYYVGILSYPMVAYLMVRGIVTFKPERLLALKGVVWKDINQKYKNDYAKAVEVVLNNLERQGSDIEGIKQEVRLLYDQLTQLNMKKLGRSQKPPEGW